MDIKTDNIVRKFARKECFDILKRLIVDNKADQDTYMLILLWLTGVLNKRQYAHLRTISGGNIIARDINSNTDELIELVHEIIIDLMYSKINYAGKGIGLKYKVGWKEMPITNKVTGEVEMIPTEGNEGRAVSFIYTAFKYILSKTLGKNYRGEIPYSNLCNIRKTDEMLGFRARVEKEEDTGVTTPELIETLKKEGWFPGSHKDSGEDMFDIRLFQYRQIYALGTRNIFTELTNEIQVREAVSQELESLVSPDLHKKTLYEQIVSILNSNAMPKLNREFLKCYYGIPSVIEVYGVKKVFEPDMVLFFELFPEYKQILKVKRIFYSGKRRNVKWVDNESIVDSSQIYKESTAMIKKLIAPRVAVAHQKYQDDIDSAQDLVHTFNQPLGLGSDLHFVELTDIDLEKIANE